MNELSGNYNQPPSNTNLLSPNKFKIILGRFPDTNFFAQRVAIPGITIGAIIKPTNRYLDHKLVGDKIEFDDLIISFLLDEDLTGYNEILTWIYAAGDSEAEQNFSDISVLTLTNNLNRNRAFTFHNAFPYQLPGFLFDTTVAEDQPITLDVAFKFSHFTLSSS